MSNQDSYFTPHFVSSRGVLIMMLMNEIQISIESGIKCVDNKQQNVNIDGK